MLLRCLVILSLAGPVMGNPALPVATTGATTASAVNVSLRPQARTLSQALPKARWGAKNGRSKWTRASIDALRSHASNLPDIVPRDIANWCPAYPTASRAGREAFWVGLVSSLVKHESTYRPTAVGGGGKWYGLTQILPATARGYKCHARTGEALKNPTANLSCAFRIMAYTVNRDQVVSQGMRGVAADWGPFHSSRKRNDMKAWTRSQSYCRGMTRSLRPVARPGSSEPFVTLPAPQTVTSGVIAAPVAVTAGVLSTRSSPALEVSTIVQIAPAPTVGEAAAPVAPSVANTALAAIRPSPRPVVVAALTAAPTRPALRPADILSGLAAVRPMRRP